ncbi:MAG: cytochrome C oxidase subunit IV family protein [Candidatus Obscuribacterales bacterium]|nr:cytochrome C oxidase subunit IV family protein [Steroidobacteraceae bacterium]
MEHAPTQQAAHPSPDQSAAAGAHAEGQQQHPVRLYLWIWILLFVLSAFSYMVDYFQLQGPLRWTLIIMFMLLKAGFIIGIFMHMAWERLALKLAILTPPLALGVLITLMAIEGDYTFITRLAFFVQ